MAMFDSLYGSFRTHTFSEIYPEVNGFVSEVGSSPINPLSTQSVTVLYYLLYGKFKNWSIANADENAFKAKMMNVIYMYGPTWEKRLDIQKKLINLTEDEIVKGTTQIYNHSFDPGSNPSTLDTEELDTVNDQNVNKYTRNKLDAYENLYAIIKVDVSKAFLDKFTKLFNPFAQPQLPLLYDVDEED